MTRTKKILIGIGVAFAAVILLFVVVSFLPKPPESEHAATATPSAPPSTTAATSPTARPTSTVARSVAPPVVKTSSADMGPSGLGVGEEICSIVGANGATYYLDVTSWTDNNLSECDMGKPLKTTLGELMDTENVDRRCIYDGISDPSVDALVGVYSRGDAASRAAAEDQCQAHGGS